MDCVRITKPVVDKGVRGLCIKPYRGHIDGCPKFRVDPICPPTALLIDDAIDLSRNVYCVWNKFNLGEHVARMKVKQPDWSVFQLECCLYWQSKARKQLRIRLAAVVARLTCNLEVGSPSMVVLTRPEANGVNVTATMRSIGIELEWPPKLFTYQVAIVGYGV